MTALFTEKFSAQYPKGNRMRISPHSAVFLAFASGVFSAAAASQIPLQSPEPSAFADTEATVATEIAVERNSTFTATVSFEASPTNCVELAFGRDSNFDGALGWPEAALKIGWDAGEWVMSSPITGETLTAAPLSPSAPKTFSLSIHVRADGSASSLELRENGTLLFMDALALLPRNVRPGLWNCIKSITRGAPRELLACTAMHRDGTMLIMR